MPDWEQMPDWIKEAAARADEPLSEELVPYLVESSIGTSLKHPLVFDVPFFSQLAWRANDQLIYKKKALKRALKDKNWGNALFLYERPYRCDALMGLASRMPDDVYWMACADIWTDTENSWQHSRDWTTLFSSDRPEREMFMVDEEKQAFAELSDTLTVYRGYNGRGKKTGWAWTLDEDKGRFFAYRLNRPNFGKPPTLITGTVSKNNVIGLKTGRGENEIVVSPKHVQITKTEKLSG